jgi:S-DNA-T family DNA segregation ATPase FtsK/SpoIIIE
MENVIQKYLRNDFETIAEYNDFAGEVAEAFRFLVVANFPVNFTEAAARRLTSIAASGARCGVYVLMTTDTKQPLPMRFDLKDIESYSTNLAWEGGKFVWKEPEFGKFPLAVDSPPPEERFTQIVQLVGESAKDSRRVEVPFEYIAPADDKWWAGSTSHGIDVALGRAGATKLQHLRLGHGTSQHVLVAGKTGSGKSTLLHALITNLALTYSPAEIELYLIDFKKGVEFKTYATHELPHARVIAIESEREFGLSVLQNLDSELRRRGDLFRHQGVQDLAGFRQAEPATALPRILLVVDEFHELFVEDDKIAQDAALLLDRLVRQGRAFGMHVLLGSQTLGGAYSLARSTIGQMAVRIALQCSENDAHLILSEDNSAARLLTRPGEAIYNDANGMVIGNNPFQVVWLSDERREVYLQGIRELAERHKPPFESQQIVFEGNVPADVGRNRLLNGLLSSNVSSETPATPSAWLGEAIAIKDPTAAAFRRQNGCNLLLIGQREESACAIMAAALVSLAAQQFPTEGQSLNGRKHSAEARFYLLEPTRSADRPGQTLAQLAEALPHPVRVVGRRDVPAIVAELAEEVERRHSTEPADAPAIYLFVFDLARFRDLRRDENLGYSFGAEPRPVNPGQQFSDIVREGPAVGVHTIAWCDTLNNLQRAVDRQGLREFDLRVLFQMSGADSSQLIDTPLASKLGPNLALFYNEEEGRVEKFRPYAWPVDDWLAWVRLQLLSRSAAKASGEQRVVSEE